MKTKRCVAIVVAATLAAVGMTGAVPALSQGVAPAQAQEDPPEPDPEPGPNPNPTPPEKSDFQLNPSKYNSFAASPPANSFPGRVAKLDKELPKLGVQNLLEQGSRTATFGDKCSSAAFKDMTPPAQRYCFDKSDTSTPDAKNLEWMPQGVTTVADAQQDQKWGTKKPILVSWYDKGNTGAEKGVRVSFLDPDTKKYQHVLLVYPYINSKDNPSYEIVSSPQSGDHAGIHAGGIMWYGNYLYVVDTNRGIRAFDMRKIFDLKAAGDKADLGDKKQVGRQNGKYYSFGYRYVMPQVASWENPGGLAKFPPEYKCSGKGVPKYSFISLDRSDADKLITGEYCAKGSIPNENGRVAQWPMDASTGLPKLSGDGNWHASKAFRLPVSNVQGAVSYEGRWYLSQTGGGTEGNAKLVEAKDSSAESGVLKFEKDRKAAIGTEDLSYWPGRNEIWTVTEHPGKRVLYGVPR
ncbi:hypothetical protein [Amycolatopsis nigrescens]|uniref:hypothetical protein n=1 Tax=Amycolatopsis nigrescens TaxID=381445 RepID=UPI00039DEBD5|nr:hypothetical protein [Amycolatopsis nigrescens]